MVFLPNAPSLPGSTDMGPHSLADIEVRESRTNSYDSTSSTRSVGSTLRREQKKKKRHQELLAFLTKHGFGEDVNAPKQPQGCFFPFPRKETLYPLHIAAKLGDGAMVRALLAEGADPEQRSSKGRKAEDLAREEDRDGSHVEVLVLLETPVRFVNARAAKELMVGVSLTCETKTP
eukprot:s1949_g5.t1